jgi:hypothetical protein
MKIHPSGITTLLLLWGTLAGASASPGVDEAFAPGTAGQWMGKARIVVVWTKQRDLCVTLNIEADGAVTGNVGDALITNARLKKNRGSLGQKFNVKTDYIIVGDLQGAIIAAEGITRSHVKIPLNLSNGSLTGGIHTSGAKLGGKDHMILSAAGLTLNRADGP